MLVFRQFGHATEALQKMGACNLSIFGKFCAGLEKGRAEHSDLRFANEYADGSAAAFSDGYFARIGRTFFADRADVDRLYGSRFEVLTLELESHENVLGNQRSVVAAATPAG